MAKKLTILTVPHTTLTQKSKSINTVDKKLLDLIKDQELTLVEKTDPEGVGLSAPQVGQLVRMFSLYLNHDNPKSVRTLINPVLIEASQEKTLGPNPDKPYLEGCLSIPNIYGPVWRHSEITLEYQVIDPLTSELRKRQETFKNFPARVVQHELDHLDGILFTQKALEQGLKLFEEKDDRLVEIKSNF